MTEDGDVTNLNFIESNNDKDIEIRVIRGTLDGPLPELKQPIKLVDDKIPEQEVSSFNFNFKKHLTII